MGRPSSTWQQVILLPSLLLAGCGTNPKILTLNYRVFEQQQAEQLLALLQNGNIPVESLVGQDPCNLTVNFARGAPQIMVNGNPGPGFNVRISSANPVNITKTNDAACPNVDYLGVQIGSGSSASLQIGEWTTAVGGDIRFTNGLSFTGINMLTTNPYFRGKVGGVRATAGGGRYSSGEFEFVTRLDGQRSPATTLVAVKGAWAR